MSVRFVSDHASSTRARSGSGSSSDLQPPRKARRPRPQYSCNECRRLKMRCDRKDPCGNCLRRQCVEICQISGHKSQLIDDIPQKRDSGPTASAPPEDRDQWDQRLSMLENILNVRSTDDHSRGQAPRLLSALNEGNTNLVNNLPSEGVDLNPTSTQRESHPPSNSPIRMVPFLGQPPVHNSPRESGRRSTINITASSFDGSSTKGRSAIPASLENPSISNEDQGIRPVPIGDTGEGPEVEEQSHGTLVISSSGQSRYLGRTAGGEWLKNQENVEAGDSPPLVSRPHSPLADVPDMSLSPWAPSRLSMNDIAFPFNTVSYNVSTASLISRLPPRSDGQSLFEAYFRHFTWHFNVVSRDRMQQIFSKVYAFVSVDHVATSLSVPPEELALLYAVFGVGAHYSLELPADDSSINEYLSLTRCCLAKGDFLARNTIAAVQTLHIISHLLLSMDAGKNGDSSWPLWGLAMRMIQGMGLHRDGERWGLPQETVEERRRVFWEVHATDVLTSNCFSRPYALDPDFVDTAYPNHPEDYGPNNFHWAKFDLSHISRRILAHAMKVHVPPYSQVQVLHEQMRTFELDVPYHLRCQPVLSALPSTFPEPNAAMAAAPPTNKRDLQLTFQQFTLALNIAESLVFLHRPYYAKALHDSPEDPARSQYGQSYLVVVERCNAIVIIASNLYGLYPQVAARHWWIWVSELYQSYHALNSAACMGTLILRNPHNVLAPFAVALVDTTLAIYKSVVSLRNSPRMVKNLRWLERLRAKVANVMAQPPTRPVGSEGRGAESQTQEEGDDTELLGWKTRLIQRAGQGFQSTQTIRSNTVPSTTSTSARPTTGLSSLTTPPVIDPHGSTSNMFDFSEEALLNSFWDPTLMQEGERHDGDVASLNWWLNSG